MQTMFTYGSQRSGLSPRKVTLGAYAPTNNYDSNAYFGTLPANQMQAVSLVSNKDVDGITSMIANLTKFESDVRAWYDDRVNHTRGDKRARIQNERDDLLAEALSALQILKSGLITINRQTVANTTSKQTDFDPSTGKVKVSPDGSIVVSPPNSSASDMTKFLIPIGAGLAALFFLKGH